MSERLSADLAALRGVVDRLGDVHLEALSPSTEIGPLLGEDLARRRVLVIGPDAAHTGLAFVRDWAAQVLACETDAAPAAEPDLPTTPAQLELRRCGWEDLDPAADRPFQTVHCDGLLHRVLEPVTLLRRLRAMTAPGGTLLIGSMLLSDPERSELLRFVPHRHNGDPSWWFVPGRLAFRWMVQTAGFVVQAELDEQPGPQDGFAVVHGYLRARAEPE